MRCYECAQQAVALCRTCLVGQCETHLAATTRDQSKSPTHGCRHTDERIAPATRSPS